MPLPFLRKKQNASVIVAQMDSKGRKIEEPEQISEHTIESPIDPSIIACAQDLLDAIHAQDVHAIAKALMASHELAETTEQESEEISNKTNNYDEMNRKAGELINASDSR